MFCSSSPRSRPLHRTRAALAAAGLLLSLQGAQAAVVSLRVTVQNLAPADGIAFAPLHVGFGQGVFDAFDAGSTAGEDIISVAEGGSGSAWQPAFAAAEPGATRGTIGGLLLSGATASMDFTVNTAINPFFTFASMVVPSNDHFIGNDSPTEYQVFDAAGNLLINQIDQDASEIWDAGSETSDPLNAAFLVVGNNDLRTPQNSVVSFNFSELSANNGFQTGAGYVFNNNLGADTPIYRIGFEVLNVPEPTSAALTLLALAMVAGTARAKRRS